MASSIIEFPVDELQTCLRNDLANSDRFVQQANSLNSAWIYEIVKLCHNTIFQTKELPTTKLNALLLVKDLMQTCQIPCVQLIEVYILPIVYKIAIEKPQEKGERRGSTFFHNTAKPRIPNIQEIGIKFMSLCSELLFSGSFIKPHRNFQSVELSQKSQFFDYFEKFKKYGISGIPERVEQLKYFNNQFKQNGRKKYIQNLASFYNSENNYAQYFVTKIIESIENESNPLMNTNQSVSSIANDLDMRKLLKYGDTVLTSPLIQELLLRLNNDQSFMVKKNALSLLTDFIKWGDGQAYAKVCYDTSLENIGKRIAEVNGNLGLGEGENIYPEVKGQRDGKRKFYAEYLKSLQMISNCLENEKLQIGQTYRIKDLYNYLKKEKKFEFPQNLMARRIETQLHQYLSNNEERNYLVLKKMREENGSGNKQKKSKMMNSSLYYINRNFEQCLEEIVRLPANEKQVDSRMTKIINLKERYEGDIEKLAENSQLEEDQFEQILDNEQELNKIVQKLTSLHSDYKTRTIDFNQFKAAHASLTKDFDVQQIIEQSLRTDKSPRSNLQLKQSVQEVVNSFNLNNNHALTSPDLKIIQARGNAESIKNQVGQAKNNPPSNSSNIHIVNGMAVSGQPTLKNYDFGFNKATARSMDAFVLKNNQGQQPQVEQNMSKLWQNHKEEQEIINQVTSSIISRKNKLQKVAAFNASETSVLKNRVQTRKKERESILKQREASQINPQNAINFIEGGANSMNEHALSKPSSMSRQMDVQYVDYVAPASFKMPKTNQPIFNAAVTTNVKLSDESNFAATTPALIQQDFITKSLHQSKQNNDHHNGNMQISNGQTGTKLCPKPPTFDIRQQQDQFIQPPHTNNMNSDVINQLKQDNPNKYKQPEVKKVITSSGFAGLKARQPQFQTEAQWNKDHRLYQMYKQDLKQNWTAVEPNHEYNKENPLQQYYGKSMPQDKISQRSESNVRPQESGSFHTCRQSQSSYSSLRRSVPITPISQTRNLRPSDELRSSKSSSYHSVQNKDSFHSISLSRHLNNNYIVGADEEDYIREPDYEPLQNSYYDTDDIVTKLSNLPRPNFKDCFQIDKEIMPSPIRNSNFYNVISINNQSYGLENKESRVSNNSYSKVSQHSQYLLAKLSRENKKEHNQQVKELSDQVIGLKFENSKIRNELMRKESDASLGSRSHSKSSRSSSSSVVSFSRSHNSNGLTARLGSNSRSMSPLSSAVAKGQEVNESFYKGYLSDLKDNKLKKASLKNKSILIDNEQCEIGCVFKNYFPQPVITASIYFTPRIRIKGFKHSITKQPQLEIDSYCKSSKDVPENKQIKIEVNCRLKNPMPYNLPLMNISYRTDNEQKNCSFYLPITFNKFLVPHDLSRAGFNLSQCEQSQFMLRTSQFVLNPKVAKINSISQAFPSMKELSSDKSGKSNKYAAKYSLGDESLVMFISTRGRDRVVLQAVPMSQNARPTAEFLLLSLKQVLEA